MGYVIIQEVTKEKKLTALHEGEDRVTGFDYFCMEHPRAQWTGGAFEQQKDGKTLYVTRGCYKAYEIVDELTQEFIHECLNDFMGKK